MVTILPAERTPWDVISKAMGQNISQNLPGAVQRGYERQTGMNALDQLEQSIRQGVVDPATGQRRDLTQQELGIGGARAGVASENLQRGLGPLMDILSRGAKTSSAFPDQTNNPMQGAPGQGIQNIPGQQGESQNNQGAQQEAPYQGAPASQQGSFATPSPFNIMTPQEMIAESERYAKAVQDPNAAAMRLAQLQNQNGNATQQREDLENMALKSSIASKDLPRFMQVGAQFDPRNPTEWMQNAKRAYDKVRSNDEKIQKAFYPDIGSGLLGRDRDSELKRLVPTSLDQKALGLEDETRKFYADQYMSPTEIEEQFRPLTPKKEKEIKNLPAGLFPKDNQNISFDKGMPARKKGPIISYEEALEKAPKELEIMQHKLADFFKKNVDNDTSLLVLRDKLWKDKDYDWRQIGPAIREAMRDGLKLDARQSTELTDVETNPPMQSLPDIFRDLSRIPAYLRGNK